MESQMESYLFSDQLTAFMLPVKQFIDHRWVRWRLKVNINDFKLTSDLWTMRDSLSGFDDGETDGRCRSVDIKDESSAQAW